MARRLSGEGCSSAVVSTGGVRWFSAWMFRGGGHPWLRRRSGMWLNGGLWRFTVEAGGCVGNRSRRWPWSALSRLAGGRRGRLTWCPCQDVKIPFMESHGLRCRGLVVPLCQVSAAQGVVGIRVEHHGGALGPCRGRTSNNSSRPWPGQREDLSHPICQPMSSLCDIPKFLERIVNTGALLALDLCLISMSPTQSPISAGQ